MDLALVVMNVAELRKKKERKKVSTCLHVK